MSKDASQTNTPRGWAIPVAVVAIVVALVAAAFAIALIDLSSQANRSAASTPVAAGPHR